MLLEALNTVSGGTLEVTTAQERTYSNTTNLKVLRRGKPGAKNIPILRERRRRLGGGEEMRDFWRLYRDE